MILDTFLLYTKFILILLSSLNISFYFKKDFFKINILLISLYVFFLLYFSFLDLFKLGNILIHIFFIINLVVFMLRTDKLFNSKYFFFTIILLFLSGLFSTKEFLFWDEFTQWGIKPKEIFINQSIFSENITTNNKYWTISLYHNIILFGFREFSEHAVILSQIFLNFCGLLFLYSFIKKKNLFNLILLVIFFYFCSSIFNYGYYTVYLDILVFLYFVNLYLIIFNNNFYDWSDILAITILLSFLFLIKGISIIFGILILFYLSLIFFLKRIEIKKLFFIFSVTLIIFFSYQYLIFISNFGYHIKPEITYYTPKLDFFVLNDYFFSALNSNNIYEGKFINIIFKIIKEFNFDYSQINFINFKFNYYFWTTLLTIFTIIIFYFNTDQNRLRLFVIFPSLFFYTLFIYYAYRNYFGPAEAASMSSFGRYFGIFFIFWIFVIFVQILNIENNNNSSFYLKWLLIFFIITSAPGKAYENLLSKITDFDGTFQSKIIKKKLEIKNLANYVPQNKSILFIDQAQDEFYLRVARFITYPIKSNELCSSIINVKENQKQYDCLISQQEFNLILKKYDFIFFLNSNIQLIENYNLKNKLKKIHKINNLSLYEII